MTAGKSTKKSVPKGKMLAVKKLSEADKWKPRTGIRKERQRPAPELASTASWTSSFSFFHQDYLKEFRVVQKKKKKEFREKNPKDKSSGDAVFQKAYRAWTSLSHSEKAPYAARALASEMRYRKAIAKTASYRKMWDIKCQIEVAMDKMNL